MTRATGTYETTTLAGEEVRAFLPSPLPPDEPPLDLAGLESELTRAQEALRLLEVAGAMVPSVGWFVYAFVRKEAVLSSQIEGTQSTLIDLLKSEADKRPSPDDDLEEVCCYLDAVQFAWGQLESDSGLPLSMRLLCETHARLLKSARGANKQPGEVRHSQNWIGGTRPGNAVFVPPPPHRLADLLGDFEGWIHAPSELPPLVRIGLLHVQFETLHPFLDGNGRLGRLLIALLLREWNLLSRPLLYISLFLKTHRSEYYRRLDAVRTDGDWEGWLAYFLEAVAVTAEAATQAAGSLHQVVSECRTKLHAMPDTTVLSLRLFELLPEHPVLTVSAAMNLLDCTRPAASKALGVLSEAGFMMPLDKKGKGAMLGFEPYLAILREGTDKAD